ncbi:unnamed protein product, partial [Discosporangium mesarthrocarpum]
MTMRSGANIGSLLSVVEEATEGSEEGGEGGDGGEGQEGRGSRSQTRRSNQGSKPFLRGSSRELVVDTGVTRETQEANKGTKAEAELPQGNGSATARGGEPKDIPKLGVPSGTGVEPSTVNGEKNPRFDDLDELMRPAAKEGPDLGEE